jgi:RNA polymerase sigma-70 factor (ECF subfamily)
MQRINNEERWRAREDRLRELLRGGLAGSSSDYQAFLKELSAHLRAFLRKRMTRLPDEVEDLVQESLLAIHNQRHTYDPAQPLSAWVQAIARYKLVDRMRREAGRDLATVVLDDDVELFAATDNVAEEAKRDVHKLLDELPDHHRLPILYTKLDGLSVQEAAVLTGMSESAIKVGVHRGLKALAARIRGAE